MIGTVYYNQTEILQAIMELYCLNGWEMDATYSTGQFYADGVIPDPNFKFDIAPRFNDVIEADVRDLPLPDLSMNSGMFDPPFLHAHGKQSIMGKRFGSYKTQEHLYAMYQKALKEYYRVLEHGTYMIFKCQDTVESCKQVWSHIRIFNFATAIGFQGKDLFVLGADTRVVGHNHQKQQHARKYHCFFWVFKKPALRRRSHGRR